MIIKIIIIITIIIVVMIIIIIIINNNNIYLEFWGCYRFNKAQFFRSCLRILNTATRSYSVGGLAVIPRIIAYIVIWVLTPRGFNHAVLTEDDLILIYGLVNKIKVNWVSIIKEQLVRIKEKAGVSHSICCTTLELYRILWCWC